MDGEEILYNPMKTKEIIDMIFMLMIVVVTWLAINKGGIWFRLFVVISVLCLISN